MADTDRLLRPLSLLAAIVLVVGGVAVAVHHSPSSSSSSAGHATVATLPAPVAPANPDAAGQLAPPAQGVYRYEHTTADGSAAPYEYAILLTATQTPPYTTVHELTTTGVETTDVYGPTAEVETAYTQVGTGLTDEITCPDQPAVLEVPLPIAAGNAWSTSTGCYNLLHDAITVSEQARVVGPTHVTVGKATLAAWELVIVTTVRDVPSGGSGRPVVSQFTATRDISARYGLLLRQVTQLGSDPSTTRVDRLVSITPT